MLVITRKQDEAAMIGDLVVDIAAVTTKTVTLGIQDLEDAQTSKRVLVPVPVGGKARVDSDIEINIPYAGSRKVKLAIQAPREQRISRYDSAADAREAFAGGLLAA